MAIYKELVKKVSVPADKKIKQKEYLDKGLLPIIDQGHSLIGGYTDDSTKAIVCDYPVIVFGDHTKCVKFITFPFAPGADGIKVLQPKKEILPKYLYYGTQYLTFRIEDKGYARHYQHIEKKELTIPSLPEQERIVARIEELFAELDKAVETLKKTKEQLAVYRQAVLESCIGEGQICPIIDCIEEMGQGWSPKCIRTPILNDDEWAVITTTAVQPLNFFYEENKKLPENLEARPKHELNIGDILITRAGPRSRCGVCCMVKKTKKKLMNCDKVYRIIVKRDMILSEYLEVVLNSPAFQKEIAFCKTGGSDSGVNLTQDRFLNIRIPVPEIDVQNKILSDIASRISVCDSIEKTVDTALQQAEAMRQSILKQAFEGRLW